MPSATTNRPMSAYMASWFSARRRPRSDAPPQRMRIWRAGAVMTVQSRGYAVQRHRARPSCAHLEHGGADLHEIADTYGRCVVDLLAIQVCAVRRAQILQQVLAAVAVETGMSL